MCLRNDELFIYSNILTLNMTELVHVCRMVAKVTKIPINLI